MNLYAITADYAPYNEVTFVLAETDDVAMDHGVFVAAYDLTKANYCSPTASVYLVGPVTKIGTAKAVDAPAEWEWARGVHALVAEQDRFEAHLRAENPKD